MAWPQTRALEKKTKQQNILWKRFCDDVLFKGQGWKVSREEKARVFCEGARAGGLVW